METKDALIKLLDILVSSCTDMAGEAEYGINHEHNLFDNIDMDLLQELRTKLQA
jgi:hypothetical protein